MARDLSIPFGALLLALSVGAGACMEGKGARDPEKAAVAGPQLSVVGGDSVAWGDVGPGVLTRTVKVVNTGSDSLHVTNVKASCGCTTAPIDRSNLAPGDTATIEVSMDVKERTGPQHKSLTIESNDPQRKSLVIPLTANVLRDVSLEPTLILVSANKAGVEATGSTTLRNMGTSPITVEPPRLAEAGAPMVVRFEPTSAQTVAPGDSLQIIAHVRPIKEETTVTKAVVPTSSKLVPEVVLTVTADIRPNATAGAK